jgi:hypothetical protein
MLSDGGESMGFLGLIAGGDAMNRRLYGNLGAKILDRRRTGQTLPASIDRIKIPKKTSQF